MKEGLTLLQAWQLLSTMKRQQLSGQYQIKAHGVSEEELEFQLANKLPITLQREIVDAVLGVTPPEVREELDREGVTSDEKEEQGEDASKEEAQENGKEEVLKPQAVEDMKVAELKEFLTSVGIEFKASAKRDDLIKLATAYVPEDLSQGNTGDAEEGEAELDSEVVSESTDEEAAA